MERKIDWDSIVDNLAKSMNIFSTLAIQGVLKIRGHPPIHHEQIARSLRHRDDLEKVKHDGVYYYRKRPAMTKEEFIKSLNTPELDDVRPYRARIEVDDGPKYGVLQLGQYPSDISWDTYDDPDSAYQKFEHAIDNEQSKHVPTQDEFFLVSIERYVRVPLMGK